MRPSSCAARAKGTPERAPRRGASPGRGQALAAPAGEVSSESACRALYERHAALVQRVCLRVTGNAADALDAAQETFLRVFRNLGRFRGEERLASWICAIAVNASRDVCRKRRSLERQSLAALDRPGLPCSAVSASAPGPELLCARRELAKSVEAVVVRLSPGLRQVVGLRYGRGLAYREIARELRVPIGTVKSRLTRAHEALALRLRPVLAAHEVA